MLRSAVAAAVEDHTHLQAVAGPHVHVVYYDTTIAAAEVLDDRAWGDLADQWALLARRIGALSSLPLALSLRSWLDVLQGRLGSAASHLAEIEDVVTLTGSRGLLGSPAPAQVLLRRVAGQRRGGPNRSAAHDAGRARARPGHRHRPCVRRAARSRARRRSVRRRSASRHDTSSTTTAVVLGTIALPDIIEAATRCDDTELAHRALDRLSERASAADTPWARGLLARGRALVATGDDADEQFRVARRRAVTVPASPTDMARTQLLYGEWLRRATTPQGST